MFGYRGRSESRAGAGALFLIRDKINPFVPYGQDEGERGRGNARAAQAERGSVGMARRGHSRRPGALGSLRSRPHGGRTGRGHTRPDTTGQGDRKGILAVLYGRSGGFDGSFLDARTPKPHRLQIRNAPCGRFLRRSHRRDVDAGDSARAVREKRLQKFHWRVVRRSCVTKQQFRHGMRRLLTREDSVPTLL